MRQVQANLEDMLRRCRELCAMVARLADGGAAPAAAAEALRVTAREFHLKQRVLYQIMQSSRLGSRAPALRQLVSRLNYNGVLDRQAQPGGGGGGGIPMERAASGVER